MVRGAGDFLLSSTRMDDAATAGQSRGAGEHACSDAAADCAGLGGAVLYDATGHGRNGGIADGRDGSGKGFPDACGGVDPAPPSTELADGGFFATAAAGCGANC